MAEVVQSSDEERKEPPYNKSFHGTNLENLLMGSTLGSAKGEEISAKRLVEDPALAQNKDFMRRPIGWTDDPAVQEEIRRVREKQGLFHGWPACLIAPQAVIRSGYEFEMILPPLDDQGYAPDTAEFKVTKNNVSVEQIPPEDRAAFEKIVVNPPPGLEQSFSLQRNVDTATLVVGYNPQLQPAAHTPDAI